MDRVDVRVVDACSSFSSWRRGSFDVELRRVSRRRGFGFPDLELRRHAARGFGHQLGGEEPRVLPRGVVVVAGEFVLVGFDDADRGALGAFAAVAADAVEEEGGEAEEEEGPADGGARDGAYAQPLGRVGGVGGGGW